MSASHPTPDPPIPMSTSHLLHDGIWRWALGGDEEIRISTLTKETPQSSVARSAMWGQREDKFMNQEVALTRHGSAGTLILDFQRAEL